MKKVSRHYFLLLVVSVGLAITLLGVTLTRYWHQNPVYEDFTLRQDEKVWDFRSNAKELNLIYTGYVKCPDVCPMTLDFAAGAFQQLTADELKRVQMFFISVDALHDNSRSVTDYAAQFYPAFIGLTGTEMQIRKAVDVLGLSFVVEPNPGSHLGYSISHSNQIIFINKSLEYLDSLSSPRSSSEILNKLRSHL